MKKMAVLTILVMTFLALVVPHTSVEADSGHWVNSFESVTFGHSGGQHFTHYRVNGAGATAFISVVNNGSMTTNAPRNAEARAFRPGGTAYGHSHSWWMN